MDFLKLIVFSAFIRYQYRCNIFPVSKISVPFGSVTIYEVGKSFDEHCISDGLTKKRVLPLPEPPITRMFLFLAYFGCFGRLFMVSRSVCVSGILFSNTGSMYGFISSAVPQRAEPYSMPLRYFFAFLPFTYTASRITTAPAMPISKSMGWKLGAAEAKAAVKPSPRCKIFALMSAPGDSRTAAPTLSNRYTKSR
ncbi:hypothetical protein IMSAGC012_00404 [Lachnospiraceae bacterium]|nr:hypothetical protein IMSAGC012_00404 [Lachnospiraceae bacterium]